MENVAAEVSMENDAVEVKKAFQVENKAGGWVSKIGNLAALVYTWYLWGANYDFISWGFLVYLIVISALLFIPRVVAAIVFIKDGIFTVLEQILFVLINFALIYFVSPLVIKGIIAALAN